MKPLLTIFPRVSAFFIGFAAVFALLATCERPQASIHPGLAAHFGSFQTFCLYKGGWVTGTTRQCQYLCNGNQVIITIPAYKICPLTIPN